MPYISKKEREAIQRPITAGHLNYFITSLCHQYLNDIGLTYQNINSVVGALECAKMELYRLIAVPYEEQKKKEHGSVSNLDQ